MARHRAAADRAGIAIVLQADEALPPLRVDPARIGVVLDELFELALGSSPHGNRIVLRASADDHKGVRITVGDGDPSDSPAPTRPASFILPDRSFAFGD